MPKNYLEQLLLNLESITDKNELRAFLKKSKPYHEMDNADYLDQIINAINDYIHTYKELDSKEDVTILENLKEVCLELKKGSIKSQEIKEEEYPFLDGKGRFKVFFEGLSLNDIKSLSEKELNVLLRCIQNELGNELLVKDIEPINHTNATFGTKFIKKKLGDLSVVYYRVNDYTVIVGVKRNEGLNTDYIRYDLVAKSLPNIEANLKKYAKGILEEDSNHYRTIKFLKNYLTPEIEVSEEHDDKKEEVKEVDTSKTTNKPLRTVFSSQIISEVPKQAPRKYFQWDMISDEIKRHLPEEFIDDYITVLDYYKRYGTINVVVDMNDTDIEIKEKKKIRDITKKWKRGVFKRNASLLQIKLIDNLDFDWTILNHEQASNQIDNSKKDDASKEGDIALTPITLKTLTSEPQNQTQKQSQTSNDDLNILKPITITTMNTEPVVEQTRIPAEEQEKTYTDKVIDVLVKYYEDYGDTNVTPYYKVPETAFPLGKAMNEIREEYKSGNLTERQIEILKDINFDFGYSNEDVSTQSIEKNYDLTSEDYKNIIKRRPLIKLINQLDNDSLDDAIRAIDNIEKSKEPYTDNTETKKTL